jgi:predicted anti-sigma-YlaC factor YlaD
MECSNARSMIPSYLDGELSEAQAGPLRQHLLDCQPCRASAQDLKNVQRWFARPAAVVVPAGFASRVARRAFAGDTGEVLAPAGAARTDEERGRLLRFVLACTAAAAVVLLLLSVGVRQLALPHTDHLVAYPARPTLDKALDELDRLNRAEKAAHEAKSAANPAPATSGSKKP